MIQVVLTRTLSHALIFTQCIRWGLGYWTVQEIGDSRETGRENKSAFIQFCLTHTHTPHIVKQFLHPQSLCAGESSLWLCPLRIKVYTLGKSGGVWSSVFVYVQQRLCFNEIPNNLVICQVDVFQAGQLQVESSCAAFLNSALTSD